MAKAIAYKKEITERELFKQMHNFISGSDDIKIQVNIWDGIRYNFDDEYDDNSLYLEVYVTLNDYNSCDNTMSWTIADILQNNLPQEQFEATSNKMLKDCIKLGKAIEEEFTMLYNYDDDLKKVEINVYDTLQYV